MDIIFPEVIDSTMIATFDACEQKFFSEYCACAGPASISPDLHAGGAFAVAQEYTRRSFWQDKKSQQEAIYDGLRAMIDLWGDYEPPEKHIKSFINMAGAFVDYFTSFPLEGGGLVPYIMKDGKPALEFTFTIPLPINHPVTGNPLLYGGRCDMLGIYNGLPCVVDDKTGKALGQRWAMKWGMRGQFIGYCWAAQQHGHAADACLVRGVAIQVSKYEFIEQFVQYPQHLIDRWCASMLHKAQRMVDCYKADSFAYAFGEACDHFNGCWLKDICESQNPMDWLATQPRRVWNPTKKDPITDDKKAESLPVLEDVFFEKL